jgi:tetratricopeptide (TPR) repeat protein
MAPTTTERIVFEPEALAGQPERGPFRFELTRHGDRRTVQVSVLQHGRDPELAHPAQGRWLKALVPTARVLGPGVWHLGPRQWSRVRDALEAAGGSPPWRAQLALAAAQERFHREAPGPGEPYRSDADVDPTIRDKARAEDLALLDRAVALADRWVEPLVARAYRRLGWHGDDHGALEDCERALELDPHNPEALCQLAATHRALGHTTLELAALESATAAPTASASQWHQLGECARRAGDLALARSALQRAAKLQPGNPHHPALEALVLEGAGELAEALRILREVVARWGDYVLALTALGRLLVDHPEHRSEAREVLDAAIAAGPDYAFEALFLRGQLTRLEGRPREALADLQAALAMSPSMVEAQRELALCLEADPEDVEAAELLG